MINSVAGLAQINWQALGRLQDWNKPGWKKRYEGEVQRQACEWWHFTASYKPTWIDYLIWIAILLITLVVFLGSSSVIDVLMPNIGNPLYDRSLKGIITWIPGVIVLLVLLSLYGKVFMKLIKRKRQLTCSAEDCLA
jgi:hypothetical protein